MVDSIFTVTYLYIDIFLKIVAMEMGAYSTIVCSPETCQEQWMGGNITQESTLPGKSLSPLLGRSACCGGMVSHNNKLLKGIFEINGKHIDDISMNVCVA